MNPEQVGQALRRLRSDQRLTLTDVAERAGISAATLSRVENSKQNLDVALLCTLARVLGVEPAVLFDGDAQPEDLARRLARAASERTRNLLVSPRARSQRKLQSTLDDLIATIEGLRSELLATKRKLQPRGRTARKPSR